MEIREFRLRKNGFLDENNLLRNDLTEEDWKKVDNIYKLHMKMNAPLFWIKRKWEAFMWKWFNSGGAYFKRLKYYIKNQ